MKRDRKALLVFIRYPEAGKVKKRLAREIGGQKSAEIYEKLLRRTLGVVADFQVKNPDARVCLYHTPMDLPVAVEAKFQGAWEFCPQEGQHLGERMEGALRSAFSAGAGRAVLIGSDIADIGVTDLEEAFENVRHKTAVLGPARDGGFYLVGLDEHCAAPFRFEKWGTDDIYSRTANELRKAGFHVNRIRERKDIDRPEDLAALDRSPLFNSVLSVIIPTLSSPEKLGPLVNFLEESLWPGDEIILVRGRADGEITMCERRGPVTRIECPRGRGIQQNAGAKHATGDLLFFLHDDTVPPPNFAYLIRRECAGNEPAPGCFRLEFSPSNRLLDLIARWAGWRTAVFRLPYGDQGFFCRREVFEAVGGFRRKYLMEDVDFVRRCRKLGKPVMLPFKVKTSPERYTRKGILTASLQNHMIMLLERLAVDEKTLFSLYYREKWDGSGK